MELWNSGHEFIEPQGFQPFQQIGTHIIIMKELLYMRKSAEAIRPLFLTPEQASKVSGLGVNLIRRLMAEGKIEYLQNGNRRLTTMQALWDYYQREKVPVV